MGRVCEVTVRVTTISGDAGAGGAVGRYYGQLMGSQVQVVVEIDPDPMDPSPQEMAEGLGKALDQASETETMNPTELQRTTEAAPDLVSISFDGFTKDVYESIRVGGNFETTVANIKEFLRRKKSMHERLPYTVIERIHFKDETKNVDSAPGSCTIGFFANLSDLIPL